MVNKTIRWGILSTARIAQTAFIPAVRHTKRGSIAAVASRDRSRAEAFAEANEIPLFLEGYESLLKRDDIDAVYIPLPNSMHREWTETAARYGKHVFCEKPLAVDAPEGRSMVETCRKNNVLLFEAYVFLYHPQSLRLRQILNDGAVGRLTQMYAGMSFYLQRHTNNIELQGDLAGGSLMDVGCYPITFSRFVFNEEPVSVQAAWHLDTEYGVDSRVGMILTFSDDRFALLDTGFDSPGGPLAVIQGEYGKVEIPQPYHPPEQSSFNVTSRTEKWTVDFKNGVPPSTPAIEHFQECVQEGKTPELTAEYAIGTLRVIEAVRKSALEGTRVVV